MGVHSSVLTDTEKNEEIGRLKNKCQELEEKCKERVEVIMVLNEVIKEHEAEIEELIDAF